MEKKEIITSFLKNGYSLDTDSLEFFSKNHEKIQEFMLKVESADKPPIITLNFVNTVLSSDVVQTKADEKTIKKFFIKPKKEKISVDMSFELLFKQYEKHREAISGKLKNTVSINRVQNQNELSLIVVIREKAGGGSAIVEDPTGEVNVVFENNEEFDEIIDGDIVGVVCEKKSDKIVVKRIVFPGIPLKRDVGAAETDIDYEITPDKVENKMIEIHGVNVIMCKWDQIKEYVDVWGSTENVIINLLKRRNLSPRNEINGEYFWSDNLFLNVIPDVFVTDNEADVMTSNYKGISIVSAGHWKINLRTREINKVDSV